MTEPVARRLRRLGLVRAVVRRSRSDWPLVLAAWLLLACATSLITAAATYSESVSLLRNVVRAEGITAVVATHDPMMLDLADRVVELRDGTLA